ncbi:M101L [Myxoma virus]|nr:m101L [Myxoma virus]WLM68555.1 M101L [Myxoma virus]WNN26982.1 M101L [Myxoma virus]
MAEKKLSRSSYDDYIETINKLTPQLRTILSHISGEQATHRTNLANSETPETVPVTAGAIKSKKTSKSTGTKSGAPVRKRTTLGLTEHPQIMQAVTNGGKIVYGTVKDGKLEVQGTVGEINQDLLGVESVNAGRKSTKSKPRRMKGGMHKVEILETDDLGMR